MADRYWEPKAIAVAQVASGSIDSVDATPSNNTFAVAIGGVVISTPGATDVATTAGNLRSLLQNSTHPYFAAITWGGSGGTITATAVVPGAPFDVNLTESGAGSGSVTNFADTTSSESPHDASDPTNYDGSLSLPSAGDRLFVANSGVSLLYGLDALSAVALDELIIEQTFTGEIGLKRSEFATSEDGASTDPKVSEYRDDYFVCNVQAVSIGRAGELNQTSGGSKRIKIDNKNNTGPFLRVENTIATVNTDGEPAIQYLVNAASGTVEIVNAPAGVGLGTDEPGESGNAGIVQIVDSTSASRVFLGEGMNVSTWRQQGGQNTLVGGPNDIGEVSVDGGELNIRGRDFAVTTLNIRGGEVIDSHINTSGVEWVTINMDGGQLDLTATQEDRTVTTVVPNRGTIIASWDDLNVTNFNVPAGIKEMRIASV